MAKRQKLTKVNSFIDVNAEIFKEGNVFSQDVVIGQFNILVPDFAFMDSDTTIRAVQKFQLQKVSAQAAINRVLMKRGLIISQKGKTYVVKSAEKKIAALKIAAEARLERGAMLQAGLNLHAAVWSKVATRDLPRD